MSGTLPDPTARRRAAALTGHTGDEAGARAALKDADGGVRATAVAALVRLGAATADDLRLLLGDGDPAVRARGCEEAARAGLAEIGVDLVGLARNDADATVVETAAFALGELSPTPAGAVEALVAATSHDEVLVREAAVAALGSIGDATALPAVLRASEDAATVRRRAVLALSAFDGPEVEEALARLASDRDRQVRQAAEDLVHGWGVGPTDE